MPISFWLIQLIGLVGSVISFTSLQSGSRTKILSLQILCCVLWVVHYALLGAYTGVLINILGLGRAVVCAFNDRPWAKSPLWLAFFLVCYAVSPLLTWDGPYCLLLGGRHDAHHGGPVDPQHAPDPAAVPVQLSAGFGI